MIAKMDNDYIFDPRDIQILSIVQGEGDIPKAELGRRVGLTGPAVVERLRKLEQAGVILGRYTQLDPRRVGLGLLGFILVQTDPQATADAGRAIAAVPGVQEIHHVAGEDCFLVKVRARDPESLGRLLRHRFNTIPAVRSTRTTIVLETLKETLAIPLPGDA